MMSLLARLIAITLASIVFLSTGQAVVLAQSDLQRRVLDSGVGYFDVEQTLGQHCGSLAAGSNNEERVWNFLVGKGLTPPQAAGVMGNLKAESGFDPFNQENSVTWPSGGWGIAQWTAGRREAIRDAVIAELGQSFYVATEQAGSMIGGQDEARLLGFQLEYLFNESNGRTLRNPAMPGGNDATRNAVTSGGNNNEWVGLTKITAQNGIPEAQLVEQATIFWEWNYERPGAPHTSGRIAFAQEIIARYGSGTSGGGAPGSCGPSGLDGVTCPATMEQHPSRNGYYKMPEAPNGEYVLYSAPEDRYGSRELVCVIYSVAIAFNDAMQGRSRLQIGDLNAAGHQSHNVGVAVDLSGAGELQVASHIRDWKGTYDKDATILLGKMFADTGALRNIWWCDPGDDSTEQILAYAETKGLEGQIKCIDGHADHFHVDIKAEYRLDFWEP